MTYEFSSETSRYIIFLQRKIYVDVPVAYQLSEIRKLAIKRTSTSLLSSPFFIKKNEPLRVRLLKLMLFRSGRQIHPFNKVTLEDEKQNNHRQEHQEGPRHQIVPLRRNLPLENLQP